MKKYFTVLALLCALAIHGKAFALDGAGTIEEVRVCSFGDDRRVNHVFFRLSDGQWFGTWGAYSETANTGNIANTTVVSTVLTAYSSADFVEVRATHSTQTACGVTAAMLWKTDGDYIAMTRD